MEKKADTLITVYLYDSTYNYFNPQEFYHKLESHFGAINGFEYSNRIFELVDSVWFEAAEGFKSVSVPANQAYDPNQLQMVMNKLLNIQLISSVDLKKKTKFSTYVHFFSTMYFNKQSTKCMFYRQSYRNGLDGSGSFVFMEKTEKGWELVYIIRLWHS